MNETTKFDMQDVAEVNNWMATTLQYAMVSAGRDEVRQCDGRGDDARDRDHAETGDRHLLKHRRECAGQREFSRTMFDTRSIGKNKGPRIFRRPWRRISFLRRFKRRPFSWSWCWR